MEAKGNIRKRVCKACDRCRLKKSKCDGASPCSRCKTDNAICVFSERGKLQDKVYPKGYVAILEKQQEQLVAGLRKVYSRLQNGEGWPGGPLREAQGGHPLTHDILERLDLLRSKVDSNSNYKGFEESCNRIQQKLLESGAPYKRRRGSVGSISDFGTPSSSTYGGASTTKSFPFTDSFAHNNVPPTTLLDCSFSRQSQVMPLVKQEAPMVSPTFMDAGAVDLSALQRTAWTGDSTVMDEPLDFCRPMYSLDSFNNSDQTAIMLNPIAVNPDPVLPDWNNDGVDFSNIIHNQAVA
ncbi:hypothetical protein AA0111_g11927 [Alternaria arborescens]|nr:hypothetical protein AA0111_g11927 [Alternaria arborescens]RYO14584.1 hypothetical protein AA0111_g11927 [Alternaria arborescens]